MAQKFLVIDTETGGLDPQTASILTLGAVVWNDGGIDDTLSLTIAEPTIYAEPAALRVNGLDVKKVAEEGFDPLRAVMTLENFLLKNDMRGRTLLCGHNLPFDVGFLKRLYLLAGRDYEARFSHRLLCTQVVAQFLLVAGRLHVRNTSANALFDYFGIDANRADGVHRAMDDAIGTARLLTKLIHVVKEGVFLTEYVNALPDTAVPAVTEHGGETGPQPEHGPTA